MFGILKPGQVVIAQIGDSRKFTCTVEALIGSGGQGEVHHANLEGRPVALKWYNERTATEQQRQILTKIVKKGSPSEKFLWPQYLATAPDLPFFGYIMPLKEERFTGIPALVKRQIDPSFHAVTTAGFHLANSFWQLWSAGMCYRDISINNIFIDPDDGDIRIADNDNVAVDAPKEGALIGTPLYMAPEIVRGTSPPSTNTDLYSLAVLLFQMFAIEHPLHGKKWDELDDNDPEAVRKFYGEEALFIKDPDDSSNEPINDNVELFWQIYPEFIRKNFERSFTSGLHNPDERIRPTVWRRDLIRLRDSIVYCSECDAENFHVSDGTNRCWSCGQIYKKPPHLHIIHPSRGIDVMLNRDTQLHLHHLEYPKRLYVFDEPLAKVVRHKYKPHIWALKNLSQTNWIEISKDDQQREVPPGDVIILKPGTRIKFGRVEGELRE